MVYTLIMEFTKSYFKFKPTFKHTYLKNNNLDESILAEDLFTKILEDIDIVLNVLKISPSKKGYSYWRDAILLSIVCEKDHLSICKDIYPMIAKKYNKTSISIERAMRLCFEDVLYNAKHEKNYIFNYMNYFLINPRNSQLLIKMVELIVSSEFKRFKLSLLN